MLCTLFYKTLDGGIRAALPEGSKVAFDEYVRVRVDLPDVDRVENLVAYEDKYTPPYRLLAFDTSR